MLDELEALGHAERTLVLLTGDHGPAALASNSDSQGSIYSPTRPCALSGWQLGEHGEWGYTQ